MVRINAPELCAPNLIRESGEIRSPVTISTKDYVLTRDRFVMQVGETQGVRGGSSAVIAPALESDGNCLVRGRQQ